MRGRGSLHDSLIRFRPLAPAENLCKEPSQNGNYTGTVLFPGLPQIEPFLNVPDSRALASGVETKLKDAGKYSKYYTVLLHIVSTTHRKTRFVIQFLLTTMAALQAQVLLTKARTDGTRNCRLISRKVTRAFFV